MNAPDDNRIEVGFVDSDDAKAVRRARVERGASLLDAARAAGIAMEATCGARGRCRSCRCKILSGEVSPATMQDTLQLGHEEVQERFRLGCQARPMTDCEVMALPPKSESGHQILTGANPGGQRSHGRLRLRARLGREAPHRRRRHPERRAPSDLGPRGAPRSPGRRGRSARAARGAAQAPGRASQAARQAHRHHLRPPDRRCRSRRSLRPRLRDGVRHRHHQHRRHPPRPRHRRGARGGRRRQPPDRVRRRSHVAHRLRAVRREEAHHPARQGAERTQRIHPRSVQAAREWRARASTRSWWWAIPACTTSCSGWT